MSRRCIIITLGVVGILVATFARFRAGRDYLVVTALRSENGRVSFSLSNSGNNPVVCWVVLNADLPSGTSPPVNVAMSELGDEYVLEAGQSTNLTLSAQLIQPPGGVCLYYFPETTMIQRLVKRCHLDWVGITYYGTTRTVRTKVFRLTEDGLVLENPTK